MLFIVLTTAAVFILGVSGNGIIGFLFFHPELILIGQVWRLITWIVIPVGGNIFFAVITLFFYYFIGSSLEREWGAGKFTIFYFSGVILNVLYGFIAFFFVRSSAQLATITPVYLNLSMLFAFATLFPDYPIRLFFLIQIKIKWLALFSAAFFLYEIIAGLVSGYIFIALIPLIAILNYILICGDELFAHIRPLLKRSSPQVINFNKAAKKVKRDLADKPYRHKCAVCGRTDTEHPELEFRYCSRCNGYHCYCSDHINNHIHFT